MKKLLLFILIVVAVAGVCVVTCPDKEAHSEALKDLVNTVLTEELAEGESESDAGFVAFGSMLGTGIAGIVLDNTLKVENHFVCSVGTITYAGKTKIVSIGILNHVFTVDKEDFKQALESL